MIEIGHNCTLTEVKDLDFGAYLDAGKLGEVLLPRRYITPDIAELKGAVPHYVQTDKRP